MARWYWGVEQSAAALLAAADLSCELFDLNIAGAGADSNGGASAVDDAADVMSVEAALHGDGLRDVDAAGAGIGVEVEVGVADDEADGAAAGGELPVCGGLACGFDVAAAGAGFEGSGEAAEVNVAAAGFSFDVAGAGLLEFECRRSRCRGSRVPGCRERGRSRSRSGP